MRDERADGEPRFSQANGGEETMAGKIRTIAVLPPPCMSSPRTGFGLDLRGFAGFGSSPRGGLKHEAENLKNFAVVVTTGFEPVLKYGCDFAFFSNRFDAISGGNIDGI